MTDASLITHPSPFPSSASSLAPGLSLVMVNTCCVTREAERSSINRIRQATRMTPKPYLIVAGCMAENDPERVGRIAGVDEVLGIAEKERLIANVPMLPDRSRAFLKVQDGCDNHCRYCIASRLRPAPKSKPVDQVSREAVALQAAGFHEIVLVGLNLGSYGRDIGSSLAVLLRTLARVSGPAGTDESRVSGFENLERSVAQPQPGAQRGAAATPNSEHPVHPSAFLLRLSSLEPDTLTDELMGTLAALSGPAVPAQGLLCPHLHISLQSGDDGLLKAMGRHYRVAGYRAIVERLLRLEPDVNIGTDVIVGFPGEDDAAFHNTVRFVEDLPFGYLHIFSYSPRPGTEAFASGDPVPRSVKKERVGLLRQLSTEKSLAYRRRFTGRVRPAVLTPGNGGRSLESEDVKAWPSANVSVLTDNYIPVRLRDQTGDDRQMVAVRIDRVDARGASGTIAG